MRELKYYLDFSEKLIKSYSKIYKRKLDISEDFISYVAHRMIKGDMRFDVDKISDRHKDKPIDVARSFYLRQQGIFGIKAYLSSLNNRKRNCYNFSDIENSSINSDSFDVGSYLNIYKDSSILEDLCDKEEQEHTMNYLNILVNSSGLTKNEMNVISQICKGKNMSDIARENNVSPQAINISYQKALKKM